MKKILIALVIVSVAMCQAPHPIPIPNFNVENIEGSWYLAYIYNTNFTQNLPNITCFNAEILPTGTSATITLFETVNGETINKNEEAQYTPATSAVWTIHGHEWAWIAIDPVGFTWAQLGSMTDQQSILLSNSPVTSIDIINTQILFAKSEGYNINSTNILKLTQNNCEFEMSMEDFDSLIEMTA
jgi:lipocalin